MRITSTSTSTATAPRPVAAQRKPRSRTPVLLGVSLAYFLVLLDTTVLTVALPGLGRAFHTGVAGLQWTVDAYTVTFAACLLGAGAVADRHGPLRMLRAGVVAFGILSALCAAAPTLGALVAGRALLGTAGAACVPGSLAVVATLYPRPEERARAMGTWAAVSGCALALGPVVGGLLIHVAGWRTVFLVNPPVALVCLLLMRRAPQPPRADRPVDVPGQLLACACLALLTGGVIEAGERRYAVALVLGVVAVAAGWGFLRRRSLPQALTHAPGVGRILAAGAAVGFVLAGVLFTVSLWLGAGHGPVAVGLAFLPMTVPMTVNPLLTGRLTARWGAARPAVAGLVLLVLGAAGLAVAGPHGAYGEQAVALAAIGFGTSFALPALVAATAQAAPQGLAGTAGGLFNAVRQTGSTVGVAVLGAVPGRWAFAVAAALPMIALALWTPRRTR